jgi:hypothetical protein
MRRAQFEMHTVICPFFCMRPYLEAQRAQQMELESQNKQLRQKVEELSSWKSSTFPESVPEWEMQMPSFGSSAGAHETPSGHLLSLYESLRADVDGISQSLPNLEAKLNMLIINESLQGKEEIGHMKAVISGLRIQLQWVLNNTKAQQVPHMRNPGLASNSGSSIAGPSRAAAGPSTGPRVGEVGSSVNSEFGRRGSGKRMHLVVRDRC